MRGKPIHETTRSVRVLLARFRVISWIVLFVNGLQGLPALAQQTKKLPAAEKIVDNYLKAIGGKKQEKTFCRACLRTFELRGQSSAPAS